MNLMSLLGSNRYAMQAIGAMMRGEDPKTFMRNLATTNPQLQGLNLDNLEETAKSLCEKNNLNMDQLAEQIQGLAHSNI